MCRTKLLLGLLLLTAIACGVWFTESVASARGRRGCWQSCACPQTCVQYVPIYIQAERPRNDRAKKVNFLFILDTETTPTNKIGKAIAEESLRLQTLLFSALPAQFRGSIDVLAGPQLSEQALREKIRDLPVGRNETLFVYANLHGEEKENIQILQLRDQKLTREALLEELKQKGAYLTVLITDSCFQSARRESNLTDDFGYGVKPTTDDESPEERFVLPRDLSQAVMVDLLINHKGIVDINSCKKGELALTDVFTTAFVDLVSMKKGPKNEPPLNATETRWPDFFQQLKTWTAGRFEVVSKKAKDQGTRGIEQLKDQKTQTPVAFEEGKEADKPTFPGVEYRPRRAERGIEDEEEKEQPAKEEGTTPAAAQAPPAEPAPASITVHLPPDASLTIDDTPTRQSGSPRIFHTPPLPTHKELHYTIRAERMVDGQKHVQSMRVAVRGGANSMVQFDALKPETVARAAEVTVRLPEGATLDVDGRRDPRSQSVRVVQTQPLAEGQTHVLELVVTLSGEPANEPVKRRLTVQAGQKLEVDFTREQTALRP